MTIIKVICGIVLLIWLATGLVMVGRMIHEVQLVGGPISRRWVILAYAYAMAGIAVAGLAKCVM